MKIAIVEDEAKEQEIIVKYIGEWAEARRELVEFSCFPSSESFLFAWEDGKDYRLLVLDIEMGGMNGLGLAEKVRLEDREVPILFVTGYDEYMQRGYDVSALHYLMKPVDREKLFRTLDRAYERSVRDMQYLTLKMPDTVVRVPFGEIRWLEVRQNYVTVHADRDYTLKAPLWDFENQLSSDSSFYRVGRSYIVNLRCIKQVMKKEILLMDSTVIPLPRGMYEPLNREIIKRL